MPILLNTTEPSPDRFPATVVEGGDGDLLALDQYGDVYFRLTGAIADGLRQTAAAKGCSLTSAFDAVLNAQMAEFMAEWESFSPEKQQLIREQNLATDWQAHRLKSNDAVHQQRIELERQLNTD